MHFGPSSHRYGLPYYKDLYKRKNVWRKEGRKGDGSRGGSRGNYWGRNPVVGVRLNPGSFFCRIDKWEVANLTLGTVKTCGFSTLPFHSSHEHWVGFERNGGSKQIVALCFIALERDILIILYRNWSKHLLLFISTHVAKSQDLCRLHVKTSVRSEIFNLVNLETAAHAMIVEIELGSLENETENPSTEKFRRPIN